MNKWKELTVGRKRFWVVVGVIVVLAVFGWVTGWWSSPPVV
jgi:multidrug resistance efflux pump